MGILTEAMDYEDESGLIFRSLRGKPLSDATLGKLLRDKGIDCVPHGFRSNFSANGAPNVPMHRASSPKW